MPTMTSKPSAVATRNAAAGGGAEHHFDFERVGVWIFGQHHLDRRADGGGV
jgi:hypothetical protein